MLLGRSPTNGTRRWGDRPGGAVGVSQSKALARFSDVTEPSAPLLRISPCSANWECYLRRGPMDVTDGGSGATVRTNGSGAADGVLHVATVLPTQGNGHDRKARLQEVIQ